MATKEETGDISSSNEESGLKITVVLAGKREIGKSTLINKLLCLSKENEAKTGMSTNPTTKEVFVYRDTIHFKNEDGIELKVVDIPGLGVQGQSDDERHDIMAQLIAKTNKEADILLYCVSMCPGCQIDRTDIEILRLLRMVFGKDLFKHCILINTFANYIPEAEIKERAEGFADNFQGALRQAGIPDIEVKAIQSNQDEAYKDILGIPAGFKEDDPILPQWRLILLKEIMKKVQDDNPYPLKIKGYKKAMLMKYLHITGTMDKMEAKKLKDGVGSTMHLDRANTKQKVKEKLKEKERK